jgi:predicted O-linked N-acetylglucosamine transferase (SPINDLY family)
LPHTVNKQTLEQAQLIFEDGLKCLQEGKIDNADLLFAKAYERDPNNIDTLNLLGIREYQKQNYQEAIHFLSKAHHLNGNSAQTLNNLGLAHNATREFAKALEYFDLAIALDGTEAAAHNNRGNALNGLHKSKLALEAYQKAVELLPNYAEAISNQGIIFLEQKHYQEAIASLEKAVQLNPNLASAFNSLGNAFTGLHEYQLAFQAFEHALQINPHYLDACLNFGISLKKAKQYGDAIKCFEHAILLNPNHARAYFLLGEVFFDIGNIEAASTSFQKSLDLNPEDSESRFALAIAQIPKVFIDTEELQRSRIDFSRQLKNLEHFKLDPGDLEVIADNIGRHPFYLAYQEENNQALLSQYGAICINAAKHIQRTLKEPITSTANEGRKIQVGIVGHHFYNHPVWHAITKGWVMHLNPDRFEMHIFNTNGVEDEETTLAKEKVASYTYCVGPTVELAQTILNKKLDVLLFPEIGMDATTKALACLRLAPLQAVSWGHPESTGLTTTDFYLSSESFEPEGAENYYNETLITLPKLGTFFESEVTDVAEFNLEKFGIDPSFPILLCPGSPSKYLPENDAVFTEIAHKLGDCQFIFFNFHQEISQILKDRLHSAFTLANLNPEKFIKFIPFLKREEFYGLMLQSSLYLDTIGFSGFNTAMQAINCSLPIVTKEGEFMRGRFASAILRNLKLDDLISVTNTQYIDTVVKLIKNKNLLLSYKEKIAQTKFNLFNDIDPILALEKFLTANCR